MNLLKRQLSLLLKIQNIELRRLELFYKIDTAPTEIVSLEAKMAQFNNILETDKALLLSFEKKYLNFEKELDLLNLRISKSRQKTNQTKTNKEYKLSLKETDSLSVKRDHFEDDMLKCLEDIDNIKELISKKTKLLFIKKEKLQNKKELILNDQSNNTVSCNKLGEKIENIRKTISYELLMIFDNLIKKTKSTPVGKVLNSICLGCNMQIPSQLFIEIQKFNDVKFCPHCRRILYWDND